MLESSNQSAEDVTPADFPDWFFSFSVESEATSECVADEMFSFDRLVYTIKASRGDAVFFAAHHDIGKSWAMIVAKIKSP